MSGGSSTVYRGRYAPTPSGPLHFGSLVAAVGSYLEARSHHGEWLLRIEDVDTPRVVHGAADDILRTLEAFGFEWTGAVVYQSQRPPLYREAFERLRHDGLIYPCSCSRKEIADSSFTGPEGPVYNGRCREGVGDPARVPAWRVRVPAETLSFDDALQGRTSQALQETVGDFVVLRADGNFSYQLAVAVDDVEQGVTHVVRGADLLLSTTRQIFLLRCLNLPTPRYAHLPVVLNSPGEKLSKQTGARALNFANPGPELVQALAFLGQTPHAELINMRVDEIWRWAIKHWRLNAISKVLGIGHIIAR